MQTGMELELIERLKKKQVEQQQALQELQEAMSLTSRSCSPLPACLPACSFHSHFTPVAGDLPNAFMGYHHMLSLIS